MNNPPHFSRGSPPFFPYYQMEISTLRVVFSKEVRALNSGKFVLPPSGFVFLFPGGTRSLMPRKCYLSLPRLFILSFSHDFVNFGYPRPFFLQVFLQVARISRLSFKRLKKLFENPPIWSPGGSFFLSSRFGLSLCGLVFLFFHSQLVRGSLSS